MGDAVQTEGHALLKAVSQGKLRLARLLLEGGAYINEGNERGETALSAACTYADPHVRTRMVRYLLEQGADPNMADTSGRTALMRAVHQRAGVHVISLLLKNGADPALKDYSGESALTQALLHALREEHEDPDQDQTMDQTTDRTTDPGPERAALTLLLEACERQGQQVVILTCCSQGAHRTIRQYHHRPPERHHCPPDRKQPPSSAPQPPPDPPPRDRPQISINGLAPCDPAPSDPTPAGPAPCELAASPSDVHMVSAHGEGVFSFNLAPPRPRPPRVLKRLNSEPWGLSAPRALAPPPAQEEAELQKPLSLVDGPQRRHSIETHDSALSDALKLTEQLTLTQESPAEEGAEPPTESHDSEHVAPPDDEAPQSSRRRWNLPSPFCDSSVENLSNSSSPLVTRRGRQGAGLLERRGSGTLLLDHLSQPRPFLPPLFNPQRPIPDLRSANPAPSGPAPCGPGPAPRRKKLLRRHSMQPEQMKLLSAFQHVLSENEEK